MRIAILTNAYPPRVSGGAARIAFLYNELLRERAHEIRIWSARPAFDRLSSMRPAKRLAFHLADLGQNDETVREIIGWKPDVLLSHNLTGCAFGTPKAIRATGIRWVHLLHDVQLIDPSGQIIAGETWPHARRMWRQIWSLLRRIAMGEPDAAISPTEWLLKFHQGYGWFRSIPTEIIPNPVLPHPTSSSTVRDGVLFVGRVDADKGILVLLQAWKRMRDARLTVIGDGSLLTELRARQIDGFDFRGPLPSDAVLRIMAERRVVVLPSLVMENQPTVILEALASGCRVVATDVGGVRETLQGAGRIVPPGNADALADAVRDALKETSDEIPHRAEILSRHDPFRCVQRLEAVLRSNL